MNLWVERSTRAVMHSRMHSSSLFLPWRKIVSTCSLPTKSEQWAGSQATQFRVFHLDFFFPNKNAYLIDFANHISIWFLDVSEQNNESVTVIEQLKKTRFLTSIAIDVDWHDQFSTDRLHLNNSVQPSRCYCFGHYLASVEFAIKSRTFWLSPPQKHSMWLEMNNDWREVRTYHVGTWAQFGSCQTQSTLLDELQQNCSWPSLNT